MVMEHAPWNGLANPTTVVHLQRHFGVSYATLRVRLLQEHLIDRNTFDELAQVSPSRLAHALGYPVLLANNRLAVHRRVSVQVTARERSPRSTCIRTGCGTSVLYAPTWSQQPPQFLDCHADVGEDAAQRALRYVPARVHRHRGAAAVGMAHDVVAARHPRDLEPGSF
jgi:hypothetical protein